jgi:hypothetical protein
VSRFLLLILFPGWTLVLIIFARLARFLTPDVHHSSVEYLHDPLGIGGDLHDILSDDRLADNVRVLLGRRRNRPVVGRGRVVYVFEPEKRLVQAGDGSVCLDVEPQVWNDLCTKPR